MRYEDLSGSSDEAIVSEVHSLVAQGRHVTARLLVYLGEVEARRLDLRAGSSSLFHFCVHRLGMSDGEAFRRMTATRLARKFPVILELVASGALHLSGLCMLRDLLTDENHVELLRQASHKTKREIELLVRSLAPKPDVPSQIRKLPASAPSEPASPEPAPAVEPKRVPAVMAGRTAERPRLEVLTPERHRVQFTASSALREKLELALDLMSHTNPSRDLATVVDRALDLLLADLEKKRLGKAKRPRAPRTSSERRPSQSTRRESSARDEGRCSYVSTDGHPCEARAFIEFVHRKAWARGGASDTPNVRLLCRAHNRLLAEEEFGKEFIARKIHLRRSKSEKNCEPNPAEGASSSPDS